jgi:TctA family transporter
MAELFSNLALGFGVAFTPINLLLCLIGALVGTLVGVLPGIGTIATVAMLLPITFGLPPVGALIMLAGIYYGAQYGGSTTSILVNIPGEATSVSPRSTATRWRGRDARAPPFRSPRSARFSPAACRPYWSQPLVGP